MMGSVPGAVTIGPGMIVIGNGITGTGHAVGRGFGFGWVSGRELGCDPGSATASGHDFGATEPGFWIGSRDGCVTRGAVTG